MDILQLAKEYKRKTASRYLPVSSEEITTKIIESGEYAVSKKYDGHLYLLYFDGKKSILYNHGGRQLDSSPAPFDLLSDIVDAVGDKIEIICDGGIRRGTHILKALALGANACSMGRPYLYGLAAAGQPGVESVLASFESELKRNMMLMGVNKLSQLDRSKIRRK